MSMYAIMNSTANVEAIAVAALRMYAKTRERGSSMPLRSCSRTAPTGTKRSSGLRTFWSMSTGRRSPSSCVSAMKRGTTSSAEHDDADERAAGRRSSPPRRATACGGSDSARRAARAARRARCRPRAPRR